MQIHLFGAQTPTGESLCLQLRSTLPSHELIAYSRRDPSMVPADFTDPDSFQPGGDLGAPVTEPDLETDAKVAEI